MIPSWNGWPGRLAVLTAVALVAPACVYARILYFNVPTLEAHQHFDNRVVRASTTPIALRSAPREARFTTRSSRASTYANLDALLEDSSTRAFLVLADDRVVYERYFGGYASDSVLASFSMSKTFAAVLVLCAIEDGLVHDIGDHLVSYVPELAPRPGYRDITIDHLLRMTSGIDFEEESTAAAALYYSTNMRPRITSYESRWPAGTHYEYASINMQLLWEVLHRRLGGRTVAGYFESRVWDRLGASHDATWSLDSEEHGVEKFFGGLNATARDFARIGLIVLHDGHFVGESSPSGPPAADRHVLAKSWIDRAIAVDSVAGVVHTTDGYVFRGQYQWFVTLNGKAVFAKGYRGQYVFVIPERRVVVVRFGDGYGDVDWLDLFFRLANELPRTEATVRANVPVRPAPAAEPVARPLE